LDRIEIILWKNLDEVSFILEQNITENYLFAIYEWYSCTNQRNLIKMTMIFELNSPLNNSFAICTDGKCENNKNWVEEIEQFGRLFVDTYLFIILMYGKPEKWE